MKPDYTLESVNKKIDFYVNEIEKLSQKASAEKIIALNNKLLKFWTKYKTKNYN